MSVKVMTLQEAVRDRATDSDLLGLLELGGDERSWTKVAGGDGMEMWLICWPPGARTDWHDHGPAAGAFTVLRGSLTESTWNGLLHLHKVGVGDVRAFGAGHAHDVRNAGPEPALSLHAYAPRLEMMTRYRFRGDRLEMLGVERAGEGW